MTAGLIDNGLTANWRIDRYDWAGGSEAMLRLGAEDGPVVVATLPLLEEANRTRAFVVAILRLLAGRGIASALPDLPGTGDSLLRFADLSLAHIVQGHQAAVDHLGRHGRPVYGIGVRSGVLLDKLGLLHGRWQLAPQKGRDLLREWQRLNQAAIGTRTLGEPWYVDADLPGDARDPAVEIAGTMVSTALLTDLSVHSPWTIEDGGPLRVVRLNTDPLSADRHVAGVPLWRRSEPGNDLTLAALLADDIADWIARCEG